MERTATKRWLKAVICIVLGFVAAQQCLGLLLIQRTLEQARDPDAELRLTWSVHVATGGADAIRRHVIKTPADSGRSASPRASRWLFVLELCGLAILSLALFQLAAGFLKSRLDWRIRAARLLIGALVMIAISVGGLKLARESRRIPEPDTPRPAVYEFS